MAGTAGGRGSSPAFWIFLYSVATLAVFLAILISQTAWGRTFLTNIGSGGAPVLDGMYHAMRGAWDAFIQWLPPDYRPGSAQ